jgi:hypothetical protein
LMDLKAFSRSRASRFSWVTRGDDPLIMCDGICLGLMGEFGWWSMAMAESVKLTIVIAVVIG